MSIELFGPELIERYLNARKLRFYRGKDNGDFLFILTVDIRQLHAHMEVSGPRQDTLSIWVTPANFYPATDRVRLLELVNEWNRDTRWPKASVRETSDPNRVGVVGETCYPLTHGIHFEAFAGFADHTIKSAIDLFDRITEAVELPSSRTLDLWLRQTS